MIGLAMGLGSIGGTLSGLTQPAAPASPDAPLQDDPVVVLGQLKAMLDQGLITPEQYAAKQQEILGRMRAVIRATPSLLTFAGWELDRQISASERRNGAQDLSGEKQFDLSPRYRQFTRPHLVRDELLERTGSLIAPSSRCSGRWFGANS